MSAKNEAQSEVPSHVAIIMDGNGRWARKRNLPRLEGHRRGAESVKEVVKVSGEMGIKYLTLYAFSSENWKRPEGEVSGLMGLLEQFLDNELHLLHKHKIRLRTIGRLRELPDKVRKKLHAAMTETASYKAGNLVLALNYGARHEVVDAVRAYAEAVRDGLEDPANLCYDHFARYLNTGEIPDPDLIIRTGGETRLSNFLLMQAAYSEMYFTPLCWPDFRGDQYREALAVFMKRERRFGETGEQVKKRTAGTAN